LVGRCIVAGTRGVGGHHIGDRLLGGCVLAPDARVAPRRWPELPATDLLIQRGGLGLRFNTQLGRQHAPAGLVLRQRGAAVAREHQATHELAVGLLAPGLKRKLAAGVTAQRGIVAPAFAGDGQRVDGVERLLV
jgi:hypothetical protein